MILILKRFDTNNILLNCLLSCIGLLFSVPVLAQSSTGVIKGTIIDGSTNRPLYGVTVTKDTAAKGMTSFADGNYIFNADRGTYTLYFKLKGFQTKAITGIDVQRDQTIHLDVLLFPGDTSSNSSILRVPFDKENNSASYNRYYHSGSNADVIHTASIQPGTDKNGASLIQRLNVVIPHYYKGIAANHLQSFTAFGMGERYNQVVFNKSVLNSFDAASRQYPFELLPVELIEKISVQKTANPSIPADFTGATIDIQIKDFPVKNFIYVLAGAGFAQDTRGKDFLSDDRNSLEVLSFPGSKRDLPAEFPTNKSKVFLHEKNPQEQVFLSKKLKNNLAPVNYGPSNPNDRVSFGIGKTYTFKKGAKLGIIGFINHQKNERIDASSVQAAPNVIENPYPFAVADKILVRSQSQNTSYNYSANLSGLLNASILFGRNKISLKNFFGNQFINTYTQRTGVNKPDEDTLSHIGANYSTEQRKFLNSQLSGEHALGKDNRFKIDWLASYLFYQQQNPDERNFLLRQDSTGANRYAIATPSTASLTTLDGLFTNTNRLWRTFTDHNFTGAFNLHVPFNLLNQTQLLSGGVYIQSRYRVFRSDLLLVQGNGYYAPDSLLAPERYYPGGLSVQNFYVRFDARANAGVILPNNRGSYTASANLGAVYIRFENKLSRQLSLDWGVRLESNSQLVSNIEYSYFAGFKNPRIVPIDENSRVNNLDVLPSITINFLPVTDVQLQASWFRTVNRPQLQELSSYRYYDALSFLAKTGNPLLSNAIIDNTEAGITWFGKQSTTISINGFYKRIDQPIEYVLSPYGNSTGNLLATPHNTPPTDVYGVNGAVKLNLGFGEPSFLSYVTFFTNGNYTKSKVSGGPIKSRSTTNVQEHTLSGSPEYMVNGGITINHPKYPMLTVLYNRTGDYISMVGSGARITLDNGNMISALPDYRVKGREQLDIQVSQKFFREKAQLIIGVNNLLKDPYIEYQDLNGNKKFDTPLTLRPNQNNNGGLYQSGIDNTVINIKTQPVYYLTLSYLFQ